ncbi:MAG TPA: SpoIIE family protein phosphatase [Acidocella sp.]
MIGDSPTEAEPLDNNAEPWRVLIVDDDESVHSISRVVLADIRFQGRGVQLLSAYSARQAATVLRQTPDVAVVLLDVVMEDDAAGLRLVRVIRDDMRNNRLRIILRTGQPGQAPEREVIVNYDINDYKSKTELTAQKLFTATIAALRSYADIVALERSRRGLERIIQGTPDLFRRHTLTSFADALLRQVQDVGGQPGEGVVVIAADTQDDADPPLLVVAASGSFAGAQGLPYHETLPALVTARIAAALDRSTSDGALPSACEPLGHELVRAVRTPDNRVAVVYFRAAERFDTDQLSLVDIHCALVGAGLDNFHLHARLLRHQAQLESEVAARTRELAETNADLLRQKSQIDEELRVARTLQQSILPTAFPTHHAYEGAAFMRAARMIGGDFYDVFPIDEHRLGVVVADVSGKGVPAALFMVLARTILQDLALHDRDPGACLAEANRQLLTRNPLSLFVTIIYGILDARTGQFTFCSGGHIMPAILRGTGAVELVKGRPSPLIGLLPEAQYLDVTIALTPGDSVLLISDGVTECFNPADEAFGEARLVALLQAAGPLAPQPLLDVLVSELDVFCHRLPASDDVTALVVRFNGAA